MFFYADGSVFEEVTLLALTEQSGLIVLGIGARPPADALENGDNCFSLFREAVFHPGRDLVIGMAFHQLIGNEFLEGGSQYGIGVLSISPRRALYRRVPFSLRTQIILDFHLPPNTLSPYSSGQRISFSVLG